MQSEISSNQTITTLRAETQRPGLESDIQVLQPDQGDYMGFIRLITER